MDFNIILFNILVICNNLNLWHVRDNVHFTNKSEPKQSYLTFGLPRNKEYSIVIMVVRSFTFECQIDRLCICRPIIPCSRLSVSNLSNLRCEFVGSIGFIFFPTCSVHRIKLCRTKTETGVSSSSLWFINLGSRPKDMWSIHWFFHMISPRCGHTENAEAGETTDETVLKDL